MIRPRLRKLGALATALVVATVPLAAAPSGSADPVPAAPAPAYLEGEYDINGLYMGVPVKLDARGIEEILELDLHEDEQQLLNTSADADMRSIDR